MKWTMLVVFGLLTAACASATPKVYDRAAIQSVALWTVEFTYDPGRTEETTSSQKGNETRVVREGVPVRHLKLRDDVAYILKDKHGINVGRTSRPGSGFIRLLPVEFYDGGFKSVDVEIVLPDGETAARVQVKNGDRNATVMEDDSFAEYTASAIATALR